MKLSITVVLISVLFIFFQNCQQKVSVSSGETSLNSLTTGDLESCRDKHKDKDKWTYYVYVYGYSRPQCEGASDLFLADDRQCANGVLYGTFEECEAQRLREIANSCDAPNNTEIYPWGEVGRKDPSINVVPISLCYQIKDIQ